MTRPSTRHVVMALLLAATAAASAAGCQAFAWVLTKTIGSFIPEDTVQAEYDMRGRSLLVLVDVQDPTLADEHPQVESALASAIGKALPRSRRAAR